MFQTSHEYGGHVIGNEDWDGEYVALALDADAAEFGAMLLNAGGLGDLDGLATRDIKDLLDEALTRVECVCGETVFAAELSGAGECAGCVS